MKLQEFLTHLNKGKTVAGNSETHRFMSAAAQEAIKLTSELNGSYHTPEEVRALFSKIIGKTVDETFALFPPFYTDFGKNITVGKNVFINAGCQFQDQGGVTLGDGVLMGHNVVLATLNHDRDPAGRATMHPGPIVLGKNVWVGAHATLLPGVTVGDGAIVAAGAVVARDVPPNTVVGGVPARTIKAIKEKEKNI